MSIANFLIIFLIGLFIGEIFSFRAIQFLLAEKSYSTKIIFRLLYWVWTVSVVCLVVYTLINRSDFSDPKKMNFAFIIIGLFLMNFVFKTIFGGIHFVNEAATFFANLATPKSNVGMSRSRFLTISGLALASIPFSGLLYGMVKGRYDFRVIPQKLKLKNLPKSFEGVKIVHLSDMHLGSFPLHTQEVAKAVEKINSLEADYIFFTGDMINERAMEAEPWIDTLKQLKAKYGKFSSLGNHDYGDYYAPWAGKADKIEENVRNLKRIQEQMGFQLLRNENVKLTIGNDFIRLIGLENWGAGHFSKYGDLEKAKQGVADEEIQILLSHDPSHWDEEVLNKSAIDIALAGHTHGCQMGVEIPGIKWSPVQYRYPRWAGLYKEGDQQLYINRGFGYIGYAGRVGMAPEITLFTLEKA